MPEAVEFPTIDLGLTPGVILVEASKASAEWAIQSARRLPTRYLTWGLAVGLPVLLRETLPQDISFSLPERIPWVWGSVLAVIGGGLGAGLQASKGVGIPIQEGQGIKMASRPATRGEVVYNGLEAAIATFLGTVLVDTAGEFSDNGLELLIRLASLLFTFPMIRQALDTNKLPKKVQLVLEINKIK